MVHGAIVAVERKNKEAWLGSGRVGSGRVQVGSGRAGWTLFFTRLDPSLTVFSLRRDYRAAYWALRFAGERFEQAMLSLDKLSTSCDAEYNWMLQIFSSSQ